MVTNKSLCKKIFESIFIYLKYITQYSKQFNRQIINETIEWDKRRADILICYHLGKAVQGTADTRGLN